MAPTTHTRTSFDNHPLLQASNIHMVPNNNLSPLSVSQMKRGGITGVNAPPEPGYDHNLEQLLWPGQLLSYQNTSATHSVSPLPDANSIDKTKIDGYDTSHAALTTLSQSGSRTILLSAAHAQAVAAAAAFSGGGKPPYRTPYPQLHHHHRLPRSGDVYKTVSGGEVCRALSMVGREGMPPPAPRPQRPRLKFTAEEDRLLIFLKEDKELTWNQIAHFFPGRTSGTLQVRYCTKLRAKPLQWTEKNGTSKNQNH